jgi:hypothetical protein
MMNLVIVLVPSVAMAVTGYIWKGGMQCCTHFRERVTSAV